MAEKSAFPGMVSRLEPLWSKKLRLNLTEVDRKERNYHEERGRDTYTIRTG
jgi:hypothetical protein